MAPKKKVLANVKLQIRAGQATPAPPVGTALGQHGVNIMEFCRQYNDQTQQQAGQVIPAELTIYEDRSFTFITKQPPAAELIKQAGPPAPPPISGDRSFTFIPKQPPAAELIKQAAGVEKWSAEPNREKVRRVT